jgi:hypothetical protein
VILLSAGALAAGCGEAQSSSAGDFEGEERAVAEVVEDLQDAGERKEADRICRDLLSADLQASLRQAGSTCEREVERSIDDAEDFELVVEDVTVTGSTARATVRRREGQADRRTTFEFEKTGRSWRATSLAAGG